MRELQIGDRLKALRKSNNLTTSELANKINISQSYLSRFENNKAIPDIEMLDRILHALDSDLATFFAKDLQDMPPDLMQLIDTVKSLSPEARIKLNEFLQIISDK